MSENMEAVVVNQEEYQAVVAAYTGKDGKVSYDLLNKDLIKFAKGSPIVQTMADEMKSLEEIGIYAAGMRFRDITGNKDLTDEQVQKMLDMLDESDAKSVLKEFNEEMRKKLAESKRK